MRLYNTECFVKQLHGMTGNLLIVEYICEGHSNKSIEKDSEGKRIHRSFCLLFVDICIVSKMPIVKA
jgi:hypothetical protein